MAATLIVTVRHGTTRFNRLKKIAGRIDCPLDENGIIQARAARPVIVRENFDVVISSPLSRVLETARICADLPENKIIVRGECVERNYGKMQGLLLVQVKKLKPTILYVKSGKFFHSLNPPGGETFEQLRLRTERFVDYMFRYHKGKKIAVFSHQTFLQQLHGVFLGQGPYNCLGQDILTLEANYFIFSKKKTVLRHHKKRLSDKNYSSW